MKKKGMGTLKFYKLHDGSFGSNGFGFTSTMKDVRTKKQVWQHCSKVGLELLGSFRIIQTVWNGYKWNQQLSRKCGQDEAKKNGLAC